MGWGRTLLLGDIGTQLNVNDVENDLESVKNYLNSQQVQAGSDRARLDALQQETHELKIYIVTLIRLLASKKVLTQEDLNGFVNVLDPHEG
jgi:hypothetical protein